MAPDPERLNLPPALLRPTYPFLRAGVIEQVALPFRIVVLSGLYGTEKPEVPPLRSRKVLRVRTSNFESTLRAFGPRLVARAPSGLDSGVQLSVELKIGKLEDLTVEGLAAQVRGVRELLDLRDSLVCLNGRITAELEDWLRWWMSGRDASLDQVQREVVGILESDPSFSRKDEAHLVARAMRVCLSRSSEDELLAPSELLEGDLPALVDRVEDLLRWQLRGCLALPAFASLRAAWYGLAYLVREAEAVGNIEVGVFGASKEELSRDLADPARSVLYRLLVEDELRSFGGQPATVLVAGCAFSRSPQDLELLERLGDLAASSSAVLLAGVDPDFFGAESFSELESPEQFESLMNSPPFESWRRFRSTPAASRVAVAIPRMQIQMPRSPRAPWAFQYDRPAAGYGPEAAMAAVSGAYALAGAIMQAACAGGTRSRTGGLTAREEPVLLGGDRRRLLAENGFLTWRSGTAGNFGVVPPGNCCYTASALPADGLVLEHEPPAIALDAVLVGCHLAQYCQAILRDRRESFEKTPEFQQWLEEWMAERFAAARQEAAGLDLPFDSAEISLQELGLPYGYFRIRVSLRDRPRTYRFAFLVDVYSYRRAAERAVEKDAEEPLRVRWV